MTDSNTRNGINGMCPGNIEPYTTTDVDHSPDKRLIENSASEAEFGEEDRQLRYKEAMDYMNSAEAQDFYKKLRRHECNVFNALFNDKEVITEEIIKERIARASKFFDLPVPTLIDKCDTLAKIVFSDYSELGSEIRYDINKLAEIGINNPDAFDAIITHELSHQYLSDRQFNFSKCNDWCIELACDYIVGVRCSAHLIASGKYKYAVSRMKPSVTHPGGAFRYKAVEAGFQFVEWLRANEVQITVGNCLLGITQFLCIHSKDLNNAYLCLLSSKAPEPVNNDINSLPDSNLIKIAYLKYFRKGNNDNC